MKPFCYILAFFALAITWTACKSDTDIIPQTHGNVMVFNAVPGNVGYNMISVFVDTTRIANMLKTGDTSAFSTFRSQLYPVYIHAADNDTSIQTEMTIRNNHNFSFFLVYDTLPLQGQPKYTGLLTDDTLRRPDVNTVRLRVIDLGKTLLGQGDTASIQPITIAMDYDTALLYNGMSFRQVGDFRTIAPGPHKLYFRTFYDSVRVRRDSLAVNLVSDNIYTVYTSGSLMRNDQFKAFIYRHWR